jgi:hypothetical protein
VADTLLVLVLDEFPLFFTLPPVADELPLLLSVELPEPLTPEDEVEFPLLLTPDVALIGPMAAVAVLVTVVVWFWVCP